MRKNFLDFVTERNKNLMDKNVLLESFREKDVEKAISLIESILKKHINGKLLSIPGFENTEIDGNKCTSKQYIVFKGNKYVLFQFNWLNSGESSEIYSIDFFDSANLYWTGKAKSNLSIYTLGTNIVKFLPIIWEIVNTGDYSLEEKDAQKLSSKIFNNVQEKKFSVLGINYLIYEGLTKSQIYDSFKLGVSLRENNKVDSLKDEYSKIATAIDGNIDSSKKIKLSIQRDTAVKVKYDKELSQENSARKDPEQIFKEMSKYISLVIKGLQPSLILCGAPGVGKTFRVKKQLKENGYKEGDNLFTIKGKCTARKLYLALYDMRNKGDIVLIDDADSLVGPKADENCINILKAALDSSTDPEGRLVTYGIAGKLTDDDGNEVPKKCYVKSGVIVITNYRAGALDTALRNRSFMQDIDFTNEEVLGIIKKLMPNVENEILDARSKLKAYDYLVDLNKAGSEMELSLRTFVLCAKIFKACDGDSDFSDDDAKSMIKEQMRLQYARGSHKY